MRRRSSPWPRILAAATMLPAAAATMLPAACVSPPAADPAPRLATRCPEGTAPVVEGRETWCATPEGVWQGPLWIRDAEGRLRVYATGRDGAAQGAWWQLHANGRPASEAWFESDELHGPYRHWDAEGHLRLEGRHDARGRMHGRWRRFGSDGALRQEWFMEHGRAQGATRAWHPDGGLRMQGRRDAGRSHGEWRWWDVDGTLRARCVYDAGRVVEGRCLDPPPAR